MTKGLNQLFWNNNGCNSLCHRQILIASVRETTCERFGRLVLDGNVERGMPPYRTQPVVVAELDAIYAYLLARAQGEIGPGNPSAAQSISPAR